MIELTLDISNLFVTSDLHLNHKNIIKYCNRPWEFSDEGREAMNHTLIENLMVLPEGCTLLNLGDWAILHGCSFNCIFVNNIIWKLLEKKISVITVLGNHDRIFMKTADAAGSHINTEKLNSIYSAELDDVKSVWYSGLEKILLNGKYYLAHEPFFLREDDKLVNSHESIPRNSSLANIFYKAGFIENWGRGFSKIKEGFVNAGLEPPKFEISGNGFLVTIKRPQAVENSSAQEVIESGQKSGQKIIELITENPMISRAELSEKIGMAQSAVQKHLTKLKEQGILKRVGPDKGGHWEVTEQKTRIK